MKARVLTGILGIALLSAMIGCGNVEPSVPASTPETTVVSGSASTPTPTADEPSSTSTSTAAAKPTAAPTPAAAGEPTSTPAPAAAGKSTSTPTVSPTPSPTSSSASTSAVKDDYLHDLKVLEEFSLLIEAESIEDFEDYPELFQTLLSILDMKTTEGQMMKADMESIFILMDRAIGMMDYPEAVDVEELEQMNDELYGLINLLEQHSDAFKNAAKKAGLTESELQRLDELLYG